MDNTENNDEIKEFVKIFKSWDEDEQYQFYIEVNDIMTKFLNIEFRETRKIYYKNKYNTDPVWKEKQKARVKRYYYNKKKKLENKNDEVNKEDE